MRKTKNGIYVKVRSLIIDNGKLLIAKPSNASFSFLPGGQVEFGETMESALIRELGEELGIEARVGPFLGVIEGHYTAQEEQHHEYNFVYCLEDHQLSSSFDPPSREDNLEFFWHPIDDLISVNLLPQTLQDLIPEWISQYRRRAIQNSYWLDIV